MLENGARLQDRYEIIEPIGQGGMGAVYLARDQRLGNTVALKETFFADTALLAAFEREARLLAGLRHPALPKVIDHFADSQGQFLVMEYIPGDDLHDLLEQSGPAALTDVLQWADQLLDALDYLHTQSPPIIHRDIKPQNLKLTSRNQIVLLDFGLAKGKSVEISRADSSSSIFGYTPSYAPLEQIQGSGTDTRSDLYSLAATLYHLLTGKKPVDALTRAAALVDGQADPLMPASQVNPSVPTALSDVLMQGMALNKTQRIASAETMREMLRVCTRASREQAPAQAASPFARTEINLSGGPPTPAAASTHLFASAPATSAQVSEKTGAYTTRASASNLGQETPARINPQPLNRARPGTAVRRQAATVEMVGNAASGWPRLVAAGAVLAAALVIIIFVFLRGANRNDVSAASATVQKTDAATGAQPSSDAPQAGSEATGRADHGTQPASSGAASSGAEQRPPSDEAGAKGTSKEDTATPQEPRPEEPAHAQGGTPAMQEPEGTKPIPRKPEEPVAAEPKRQEQPPPQPQPYPPPPDYPPPHGMMPPPGGGPPPGGMPPPGGGPPPGRRRP